MEYTNKTTDMNNNGLHIIFIIDKSGSMTNIAEQMRTSINEFIKTQQDLKIDGSTFTCVMFSDNVYTFIDKQPLCEVKQLVKNDYVTTGSTALFDAIGMTIEKYKHETNVLLVIVTDGEENASRKFTEKKTITEMIADVKDKNKWNTVYLSCDIDTFSQGEQLGIGVSLNSSNACVSKNKMSGYLNTRLSDAVSNFRTNSVNINDSLNTIII